MVMGLPGSGKSYFARHLARHLGFQYIGSDQTRKEMAAMGQYEPHAKERVYRQMNFLAETALRQDKGVLLDATFYKEGIRKPFVSLAQQHQVPYGIICIEAGEDLIRERLSKKREDSEADFGVYLKLRKEFEPPPGPHLKLKSGSHNISEMLQEAEKYIQQLV